MTIEKAIQDNTAALLALAEVIKAAGLPTAAGANTEKPKAETPKSEPVAEKPADPAPANASVDPVAALTYADIQKPFLKLVNADKQKAVELLAEWGVPTLKEFQNKPEQWPDVLARIQKAGA